MKRINAVTVRFEAGDVVPREICYWGGNIPPTEGFSEQAFKRGEYPKERCFYETWPSIRSGKAREIIYIGAPPEILDQYLVPESNEYGLVAP